MKPLSAIASLTLFITASSWAADSDIRLNSIGFLPQEVKHASIVSACSEFQLVRVSDQSVVYSAKVTEPKVNPDTNETICTADFSSYTEPGEYRLQVKGAGVSAPFRIAPDVYNGPFATVMKGMYLWRCGTAVSGTHNGITYTHEACHTDDAYMDYVGQPGVKKVSLKGWHDAGDYNKYVVNAGVTVGCMFQAWEQFPAIRGKKLELPDSEAGNSLPDFLDEMKQEMDWLLTMQAEDGSVYHKVSTVRFGGFIKPEAEKEKRFFVPWSTAATADFIAMTAMAARIFQPYDPAYAEQCGQAAKKSYEFLKAHPEEQRAKQREFSTGGYGTRDPDDRLWAAAEMWQTFGDTAYLQDFENRARNMERLVDVNWDWGNVANLGFCTYLLSQREGKEAELENKIRDSWIAAADAIVQTSQNHGYERPLGDRYYWGCNGTVARQCVNLMVANRLSPKPEYVNTAISALDHLFGRNYYNRSQITGLGINPPMNPHDRRSGSDEVAEPWPGCLVGGGHKATDWVDVQESYQTNEIAINWNGSLIYALAAFVRE